MSRHTAYGLAAAALVALIGGSAPAAEGDLALLQTFIGTWKGPGVLVEPTKVTEFECRLTMSKANRGKLVLRAQCPLVAASGGIAFNEETGSYELRVTSSTDFRGAALGMREGETVVFDLEDRGVDRDKNALSLKATLILSAGAIGIDFTADWNGEARSGSLDFARQDPS